MPLLERPRAVLYALSAANSNRTFAVTFKFFYGSRENDFTAIRVTVLVLDGIENYTGMISCGFYVAMRRSASSQPVPVVRQSLPAGKLFQAGRGFFAPGERYGLHTHNEFAEVFWIEAGHGTHIINGESQPLKPKDIVFIRSSDVHGFSGGKREGLTLTNVAFPAEALDFLQARYASDICEWPWHRGEFPVSFILSSGQLSRLHEWTEILLGTRQTRLRIECFLLNLLTMLSPAVLGEQPQAQPVWLQRALLHFREPQQLALGPTELIRLTGRSREHVNRLIRQYYGKTTTELVQELRLEYARRELLMTNRPIMEIALDCGWSNLGYFYRLFRAYFGVTPRRFRVRERAIMYST